MVRKSTTECRGKAKSEHYEKMPCIKAANDPDARHGVLQCQCIYLLEYLVARIVCIVELASY